jgi:hypothetical protein
MPGQGADQMRSALQELAGQVRDLSMQVDGIVQQFPTVAAEGNQINTLLKQMLVKSAQVAPQTTASGQAVPTGSSQGPMPVG